MKTDEDRKAPTFVYHEFKARKGKVVTAEEAEKLYRRGWVDTPAKFGKGLRSRGRRTWMACHDIWRVIFPKNYWRMDDEQLEREASEYGIAAGSSAQGYLRQYAIEKLLEKDKALRTPITMIGAILSLVSAFAAVVAVVYGLFKFIRDSGSLRHLN